MPFYNYRCNRCETKFEVLATVEEMEKKLIPCPGCGSRDLTRVYERAAVSLMSKTACEQEERIASAEGVDGRAGIVGRGQEVAIVLACEQRDGVPLGLKPRHQCRPNAARTGEEEVHSC